MAPNRHWPSMFKSKPSTTNNHQQPHDHRNPYTSALPAGTEESAVVDMKQRWIPRPEQTRILEGIFNSGTVNPTRDDIRRITIELQEYGQIGDNNVFYWFQNKKSRTKQKQRQLHQNYKPRLPARASAPTSNNSNYEKALPSPSFIDLLNSTSSSNNSPTVSVDQPMTLQAPVDFPTDPSGLAHGGVCFPDHDANLVNELMLMSNGPSNKDEDNEKMKMKDDFAAASSLLAGVGSRESSTPKPIVFINDVCCEIGMGPFNVKETFGDDAMLLHSTGQPVLTNEWGVTHQPLLHGASYYLLRPLTAHDQGKTV